jgi:hypothetical protein
MNTTSYIFDLADKRCGVWIEFAHVVGSRYNLPTLWGLDRIRPRCGVWTEFAHIVGSRYNLPTLWGLDRICPRFGVSI